MRPGRASRTTHQSCPGPRLRRLSQPSIHLPLVSYLPGTNSAGAGFSMRSFAAKKSSLAASASAPSRASARLTWRRVNSGAPADSRSPIIWRRASILIRALIQDRIANVRQRFHRRPENSVRVVHSIFAEACHIRGEEAQRSRVESDAAVRGRLKNATRKRRLGYKPDVWVRVLQVSRALGIAESPVCHHRTDTRQRQQLYVRIRPNERCLPGG